VALSKSTVMVVSFGVDVLDGHERDTLGEIVHLLIRGLSKRNVRGVEPSKIVLVDNLPRV
jgi:hypothetical protein